MLDAEVLRPLLESYPYPRTPGTPLGNDFRDINALSSDKAIQAKDAFETYATQRGVVVKHYHVNNGIFKSDPWIHHCQKRKQTHTFCGMDSHHQNGIAEHCIQTLSDSARIQLLHAIRHNP